MLSKCIEILLFGWYYYRRMCTRMDTVGRMHLFNFDSVKYGRVINRTLVSFWDNFILTIGICALLHDTLLAASCPRYLHSISWESTFCLLKCESHIDCSLYKNWRQFIWYSDQSVFKSLKLLYVRFKITHSRWTRNFS